MGRRLRSVAYAATFFIAGASTGAWSGESGAGLLVPGLGGFGAGTTPSAGFYITQGILFYDGKTRISIEGGRLDLNARKTAAPFVANLMWVPDQEILGGRLGLSVSVPYASFTRLSASSNSLGRTIATRGWGFGDVSAKAQLGWTGLGGFSHTISTTVWFPTGRYDTGFAPNAGKNHYGVNVGWSFTKIWKDPGIELSGGLGVTNEWKNPATNYRNGVGLNIDGAVGKVFENGLTVGAAAFYYKQIGDDKGAGAILGALRGQDAGLGPAVAYNALIGGRPFSFSLRHYWEFETRYRFKGQITTANISTRF